MSRIAYVNGAYRPHAHATVHVEDRGYQFADAVYEVCEVKQGCIIDMTRHLDRLGRSLSELEIRWPMDRAALMAVLAETVRRNRVINGLVYLQVSRGVARRDHVYPAASTRPAIVVTAKRTDPAVAEARAEKGIAAITVRENRWDRVDIKTVGLLPNAMAREAAKRRGAAEAIYVDDNDMVKEGGATNVWIVTPDGKLKTRPADHGILRGITRQGAMDAAASLGFEIIEEAFSLDEAMAAREMFITAASTIVMPVVTVDDKPIANGHPGEVSRQLRSVFHAHAERTPVYGCRPLS